MECASFLNAILADHVDLAYPFAGGHGVRVMGGGGDYNFSKCDYTPPTPTHHTTFIALFAMFYVLHELLPTYVYMYI